MPATIFWWLLTVPEGLNRMPSILHWLSQPIIRPRAFLERALLRFTQMFRHLLLLSTATNLTRSKIDTFLCWHLYSPKTPSLLAQSKNEAGACRGVIPKLYLGAHILAQYRILICQRIEDVLDLAQFSGSQFSSLVYVI
jgi:hypothetical protein